VYEHQVDAIIAVEQFFSTTIIIIGQELVGGSDNLRDPLQIVSSPSQTTTDHVINGRRLGCNAISGDYAALS